jgi:hypothetical protein
VAVPLRHAVADAEDYGGELVIARGVRLDGLGDERGAYDYALLSIDTRRRKGNPWSDGERVWCESKDISYN